MHYVVVGATSNNNDQGREREEGAETGTRRGVVAKMSRPARDKSRLVHALPCAEPPRMGVTSAGAPSPEAKDWRLLFGGARPRRFAGEFLGLISLFREHRGMAAPP